MHTHELSRRRLVAGLALGPAAILGAGGSLAPLRVDAAVAPVQRRRTLMGTWVDVVVADERAPGADEAIEAAFDAMAAQAALMSRFDPGSRVSEINRQAGRRAVEVTPAMLAILQRAQAVSSLTGGAFDVTVGALTAGADGGESEPVPDDMQVRRALRHVGARRLHLDAVRRTAFLDDAETRIDLGGIAKLPILEAGLAVLERRGLRGVMINGGGDVLATARPDGRAWRIGVRDPVQPESLMAVLPLHAGVVASSGDYERFVTAKDGRRYHHIIDPATGRPSRGVHGVTLVGERVAQVNALGTAVMVAGAARGARLLAAAGVAQALAVRADGSAWMTPAMRERLEPAPGRRAVRGAA